MKIHYPALREVRKLFSPSFLMRSCTGIGVAIPPSYLEPILRKYPRVLGLLRLIDRAHFPPAFVSDRSGIICSFTLSGWRGDAVEPASECSQHFFSALWK